MEVAELLRRLGAPARLTAHLALVHDVAERLVDGLMAVWPVLVVDRDVVLLGAATHDVGKVLCPEELSRPGQRHEEVGPQVLREHGFPEPVARIARTHGRWHEEADPALEDLLVALADAVWKGTRDGALEAAVVGALAEQVGEETWSVYQTLDEVLSTLAGGADGRLAWAASHGI